MKIGKEYKWEMSHRLPFHKGKCSNLHGHSYRLILELEGDLDENGMVLDFYEIDKIVFPIIEELDHCFAIDKDDALLIDFVKKNNFKYKIMETTTTNENLTNYLSLKFREKFNKFNNIHLFTVRLYETADAYAELTEVLK